MPSRPNALRRRRIGVIAVAACTLTGGLSLRGDEPVPGEAFLLREAPAPAPVLLGRPAATALSPFQPANVTGRVRRTLLQFDALVADQAWDEAIDLIETLQADSTGRLTKSPTAGDSASTEAKGHTRYVPLARRCQQLLATLPEAGLAAYRDRVDRTASKRLAAAVDRLDERALVDLGEDYFASATGPEAMLAASELALERGDLAAARGRLQAVHPLTRDPLGRPAGVGMAWLPVDLDAATLAEAWRETPRPQDLHAANADDDLLPIALSRLVLASLRERDFARASSELRLLKALAPSAEGRLAGRRQPLADALEAMLQAEVSNPSPPSERYGELEWAWNQAADAPKPASPAVDPRLLTRFNAPAWQAQLLRQARAAGAARTTSRLVQPVIAGMSAFYAQGQELVRIDLTDGASRKSRAPGVAQSGPQPPRPRAGNRFALQQRVFGNVVRIGPNGLVQTNRPPIASLSDATLAATGGLVFTSAGASPLARRGAVAPPDVLIGVSPTAPTETVVRVSTPSDPETAGPAWRFSGPPRVRGDRLYVAMTSVGPRPNVAIACYSTATGRQRWQTELGAGVAAGQGASATVTLSGGTLHVATELGAVASLSAASGEVRWLARYPRENSSAGAGGGARRRVELVGDRVIAAPADSDRVFAWDASTGRLLWQAERPDGAALAGVAPSPAGTVVVLAGRQVASVDALTGARRMLWPRSAHAGLRGSGAAAVVGSEVFWPTKDALYAVDPLRGGLTRPPIDLAPVGSDGANLVATDYGLLVCGSGRIRLLASVTPTIAAEPQGPLSRLNGAVRPRLARNSHP